MRHAKPSKPTRCPNCGATGTLQGALRIDLRNIEMYGDEMTAFAIDPGADNPENGVVVSDPSVHVECRSCDHIIETAFSPLTAANEWRYVGP
jgi:ribosomal protein S27E